MRFMLWSSVEDGVLRATPAAGTQCVAVPVNSRVEMLMAWSGTFRMGRCRQQVELLNTKQL